ncbi:MAG: hypothetical protein ACRC0L_09230, partial [Angustibacter sp.]
MSHSRCGGRHPRIGTSCELPRKWWAEQYAYQRDAVGLPKNLLAQQTTVVASASRDGFGRLTQYTMQALDYGLYVSATYEPGLGRLASYRVDRDNVAT